MQGAGVLFLRGLQKKCDELVGEEGETFTSGVQWCYEGKHTLKKLNPSDACKVNVGSVYLVAGPDLQAKIGALP